MRWIVAILLTLAIAGCASIPDAIGGGYVSIETVADVIRAECGNDSPGGECRPGSTLDRGDVDSMRDDLQRAKNALDESNRLYNTGDIDGSMSSLQVAQTILSTLRSALELRGVD